MKTVTKFPNLSVKTYGHLPNTLKEYAVERPHKVEEIGYEGVDDGYWVYLRPGWCCGLDEHVIHETTIERTIAEIRAAQPCTCRECRTILETA